MVQNPSRRNFIGTSALAGSALVPGKKQISGGLPVAQSDRAYWLSVLNRLADPVLGALANRKLRATMPVEAPNGNAAERRHYTHLEAFGRLLAGIAPWLESAGQSGPEGEVGRRYSELARESMRSAVDSSSPDYMNFATGQQPLVDAAFLALAVLRAPMQLWE